MSSSRQPLNLVDIQQYMDDDKNNMETKRLGVMETNLKRTVKKFDKEAKLFNIVDGVPESTTENTVSVGSIATLPSDEEITQLKELCSQIDDLQDNIHTLEQELASIRHMGVWGRIMCVVKGF